MSVSYVLDQVRARPYEAVPLADPVEVAELPTPALVLNRPALARNIDKMAAYLSSKGKGFRPHAKTHKCPLICAEQLAAGAVGVCVAKVGEAAAQIAGGVQQVLITSPVTTPAKARIVGELALAASDLNIVVDSAAGLNVLQQNLPPSARLGCA